MFRLAAGFQETPVPSGPRRQGRQLVRVVSRAQVTDRLRIGRGTHRGQSRKFFEVMLMPGRRDRHQHPGRCIADIGDIVRHAGRQEQEGTGFGANAFLACPPFTLTLEDIERLLLHSVNMQPGGKARRDGPVEHACVFGVLASDEEGHWFAAQDHAGIVPGQSNDGLR